MLQMQWLGQDYNEQKELLDKLHEKTREDVFVASFSGFQERESGLPTTYCVWAEGVPTYIGALAGIRAVCHDIMHFSARVLANFVALSSVTPHSGGFKRRLWRERLST